MNFKFSETSDFQKSSLANWHLSLVMKLTRHKLCKTFLISLSNKVVLEQIHQAGMSSLGGSFNELEQIQKHKKNEVLKRKVCGWGHYSYVA